MKNTILVVLVLVVVVGGYWLGKSSIGMDIDENQDAIVMMKKQSVSIREMSDLMQSSGMMMQELGVKYRNDIMISKGKDLEVVGKKHMNENASASDSDAMKQMMGN